MPEPFAARGFADLLLNGEPSPGRTYDSLTETTRGGGRDALVSESGHKLITPWESDSPATLFDLNVDPQEQSPIEGLRDDTTAATAELDARRREIRRAFARRSVMLRNLDPESLERLRALGYIR